MLSSLKEVSLDFSDNYPGLVWHLMPQAKVVADQFHGMGLVNRKSWAQARPGFLGGVKAAQALYPEAVATIRQCFREILQDFEHRTTSAVAEGLNTHLQLLRRLSYRLTHFEQFHRRCLICRHFLLRCIAIPGEPDFLT